MITKVKQFTAIDVCFGLFIGVTMAAGVAALWADGKKASVPPIGSFEVRAPMSAEEKQPSWVNFESIPITERTNLVFKDGIWRHKPNPNPDQVIADQREQLLHLMNTINDQTVPKMLQESWDSQLLLQRHIADVEEKWLLSPIKDFSSNSVTFSQKPSEAVKTNGVWIIRFGQEALTPPVDKRYEFVFGTNSAQPILEEIPFDNIRLPKRTNGQWVIRFEP